MMTGIVFTSRMTLLVLAVLISDVSTLTCYQCTTSENPDCPLNDKSVSQVDCADHFASMGTTSKVSKKQDSADNSETSFDRQPSPSKIEVEDNETRTARTINPLTSIDSDPISNTTYKFVCSKYMFYIKDWKTYVVQDVETRKRMTKPRVSYTCARVPKDDYEDKCIYKNSAEISQVQCSCTTDLCNGSEIIKFHDNFYVLIATALLASIANSRF